MEKVSREPDIFQYLPAQQARSINPDIQYSAQYCERMQNSCEGMQKYCVGERKSIVREPKSVV